MGRKSSELTPKNGPKNGSKWVENDQKMAQNGAKTDPENGPKMSQKWTQKVPNLTKKKVIFQVTLDVPPDAELGDNLEVTATMSSDNGGSGGQSQSLSIPVRYQVFLVLASGLDSTRYLNVSTRGALPPPAPVTHHYQVKVLGQRGLPANVTFWVPTHLGRERLWEHLEVTPGQGGSRCREGPEGLEGNPEAPPERPRLVCPGLTCREFTCPLPHLEPPQVWDFRVGGKLKLDWLRQQPIPKLHLVTSARVTFDLRRFLNTWGGTELQVQTELERVETPNPLPWILGASLGGLVLLALLALGLYKVGFFKRRYKEMMEEPQEEPQGEEIPPKTTQN
ncbi:hypothetical protein HGM15179_019376 [Zosterops borbonicus]|uniref:Integrin alpha-X-like third Ig-like domain-containing protein n=1 Tax=Zosterops borbonicus TaxID=364589 RepID=A0A8K1D9G8_9PASS|nr:hypothetical protein HGM15179_019376 [Zosterops borbonicus]